MSNFREAAKLTTADLRCPKCKSVDLPPPAKPTLEREPNGTVFCTNCATTFTPQKEK